jgi:hypothetical protein
MILSNQTISFHFISFACIQELDTIITRNNWNHLRNPYGIEILGFKCFDRATMRHFLPNQQN